MIKTTKKDEYKGFHNWYQFYLEQARGGIPIVPIPSSKPIQFLAATKVRNEPVLHA